jgi:hypothetical protein
VPSMATAGRKCRLAVRASSGEITRESREFSALFARADFSPDGLRRDLPP